MKLSRGIRGVIALMSRAPADDFPKFFGAPKPAFQNSLAAIGGSVLLIMIAARAIIMLRHKIIDDPSATTHVPALQIGMTAFFYLLAFTLIAFMLSVIFDRREAFLRWTAVRHWLVFFALVPLTLLLVLAKVGVLPIMLANAALFIVFIGCLFADIRLAYKLGEMGIISAIFAACMVHAMGLSIILTAVVQMIP